MQKIAPLLFVILLAGIYAFRGPNQPAGVNDCRECHADLFENSVVHPIMESGCQFCHTSTGEEHPGKGMGFKLTDSYPGICYECHDEKNTMASVHAPVEEGDCSVCHSPHSSPYPSLILDLFSENACLDCHYIETEAAKSVHGPVRDGKCQTCHDPHQTDHAYQLKMESKELCLSCHDMEIQGEKRKVKDISAALIKGNVIHDPIKDADCMSCHFPHSGDFSYQLIGKYPIKQYADATVENFELCFLCHNDQLLTEEYTEVGTNFRNGTKNLHYLHISGNRGRNCNLCHNAHGAPNTHVLEDFVMFGKWKMPLELDLTENGGSCATGCHKRLEYNRIIE